MMDKIDIKKILEYELHSHWMAKYIWFDWGQTLIANYLAKKVKRKHRRYTKSLEDRDYLLKKYGN